MSTRLRIITGGQTGADQGALKAARSRGIATGGWAPGHWLTEDGSSPWLADYGLQEAYAEDYAGRTNRNVKDATAVLWFGNPHSPGGRLTLRLATCHNLDIYVAIDRSTPADVADWLAGFIFPGEEEVVLMIAGNRETGSPGIGARVEEFVGRILDLLIQEKLIESP